MKQPIFLVTNKNTITIHRACQGFPLFIETTNLTSKKNTNSTIDFSIKSMICAQKRKEIPCIIDEKREKILKSIYGYSDLNEER